MANRLFPALTAAVIAAVFAAGPAPAQRVDPLLQLQRDVVRLEITVKDMQSSMETRIQTLQALVEKALDRVNTMGTELQAVQSGAQNSAQSNQTNIEKIARMLEESRAQSDKSSRDLAAALVTLNADMTAMNNRLGDKLATNLNDKIDTLGKTQNQNLSGMQLQIDALSKQIARLAEDAHSTPLPTPEELYRIATVDLFSGLYDLALDGFQEIVTKYPEHPVAARAELSRGKAYFDQGNWAQAIIAYDTVLQKYKDQDTKRLALYRKGLTLANQKLNKDASDIFRQVVTDFPDTPEAILAAEDIKRVTPPPTPAPPTPPAKGTGTPQRGG